VIDHYLAKKFNLLGANEWEEQTIKAYYNNIHYLRERSFMNVTWTYADKRKVALERFMKNSLPTFIAEHEFHLRTNGSNGHYMGNKVLRKKRTKKRERGGCLSMQSIVHFYKGTAIGFIFRTHSRTDVTFLSFLFKRDSCRWRISISSMSWITFRTSHPEN